MSERPAGEERPDESCIGRAGICRIREPRGGRPRRRRRPRRQRLEPRLAASQRGTGPVETWALVAKKGRVTGPASLDGWQVTSIAGYAPPFVTGTALVAAARNADGTYTVTFESGRRTLDVVADKVVFALPFSILNAAVNLKRAGFSECEGIKYAWAR